MIVTRKQITIRGPLRNLQVNALCLGDWCVHRQLGNQDLYVITLVPIGMSLPYIWASFKQPEQAVAAMKMIARKRNSWHHVTQADFTKRLGDELKAICLRFGAIEGQVQIQWDCDKNMSGLPTKERLNGYHLPEFK